MEVRASPGLLLIVKHRLVMAIWRQYASAAIHCIAHPVQLFVIAAVLPPINGSFICIAMGKHTKTAKTFRLSDAELELLTAEAKKHGGMTAALVAGLEALQSRKQPTDAELIAMLEARLSGVTPPSLRPRRTGGALTTPA